MQYTNRTCTRNVQEMTNVQCVQALQQLKKSGDTSSLLFQAIHTRRTMWDNLRRANLQLREANKRATKAKAALT